MYNSIDMLLNSNLNTDVMITELYPKITNGYNEVVLPVTATGKPSVVFNDVLNGNYKIVTSNNVIQPLTFDEYKKVLDNINRVVTVKTGGRFGCKFKDYNAMYASYIASSAKGTISNLVSLIPNSGINPVKDMVIIPPEGLEFPLGFETYVSAVKRLVPELVLDKVTASYLYQRYIENKNIDLNYVAEIPSLIGVSLQNLSGTIDQLSAYVQPQVIYDLMLNTDSVIPDTPLENYYTQMQNRFGIREKVAKSLLAYRSDLVQKLITQIKTTASIADGRPTILTISQINYQSNIAQEDTTLI